MANAQSCHMLAVLLEALLALLMVLRWSQIVAIHLGASVTAEPQQHHAFLLLPWLSDFLALPAPSALKRQKELGAALQNFIII